MAESISTKPSDCKNEKDSKNLKYHIRLMKLSDVPEVLGVWKEVGLYEGTHSIDSFLEVDPNGFYVAINDDNGAIIGTCAGVFVDPSVAFIGLYAVQSCYQGLGIGLKLFNKVMDHIGDSNVGLYSLPKHVSTYRDKAGFRVEDDKSLCEFDSPKISTENLVKKLDNVKVVFLDKSLEDKVIDYDQKVTNYRREKLLKAVFKEKDSIAMVALDTDDNKVVGFGCFRKNNFDKAMAGPIYANIDAVAELLVYTLIQNFPLVHEKGLNMMLPDCNAGAMRMAQKLELEKHGQLPRFFTKARPKVDFDRVYCVHTPNFSPY